MFKKIKIQIEGIHCKSCKTLIETEIDVLKGVNMVEVDYISGEAWIEFDDDMVGKGKIFEEIEKLDYKVIDPQEIKETKKFKSKETKRSVSKRFIISGILLVLLVLGYFLIKHFDLLEILSKLNEQSISYWLIFLIGFLVNMQI